MLSFFTAQKHSLTHKWLLLSAIIFFAVLMLVCSLWLIFSNSYNNKVYPGVYLNKENIGGLNPDQIRDKINNHINLIQESGVMFKFKDVDYKIQPTIISPDSELSTDLIVFDADKTIDNAMAVGRDKSFFSDLKELIYTLYKHKTINYEITTSDNLIISILSNQFVQVEAPPKNAELLYDKDSGFYISPEKSGKAVDYQSAIEKMKNNLVKGLNEDITLSYLDSSPDIKRKDVSNLIYKAENISSLAPIKLISTSSSWTISYDLLASWLEISKNLESLDIKPNRTKVIKYLNDTVGAKINRQAKDAKFTVDNGQLTKVQTNTDGIIIDATTTAEKIITNINNATSSNVEIITSIIKSTMATGSAENFGIKEIIGIGTSNYAGSPRNRIQNIKVGARAVNGTIIQPGEEFSLLKTLGRIDETSGYLPELVIKDNKTMPEFGGGLCQIGTTVFRGATNSGLPITQRRNHSYRVGYYEPAGTDATIYDPAPDFRFVNDTGNYILIKSKFVGSRITFEFWGTKDGRKIERDEPTIYNIVKPAPGKIIKTTDLKPGVKKCTEKAHNGADAFFNYKVTYPSGEVKEKKFYSHYVPWQEVCLVGATKDEVAAQASSTPTIIDTSKATTTKATTTQLKVSTTTVPIITPRPTASTTKASTTTSN